MQKLSAKIIITPNWFMAQLILMHLYASVENTSCGKVTLLYVGTNPIFFSLKTVSV